MSPSHWTLSHDLKRRLQGLPGKETHPPEEGGDALTLDSCPQTVFTRNPLTLPQTQLSRPTSMDPSSEASRISLPLPTHGHLSQASLLCHPPRNPQRAGRARAPCQPSAVSPTPGTALLAHRTLIHSLTLSNNLVGSLQVTGPSSTELPSGGGTGTISKPRDEHSDVRVTGAERERSRPPGRALLCLDHHVDPDPGMTGRSRWANGGVPDQGTCAERL